jgi:hypothetical protein
MTRRIKLRLIIIVSILFLLVMPKAYSVTWTCYETSDSYWTMEQPEGYWPNWDDCEAWRYGPPDEQNLEPEEVVFDEPVVDEPIPLEDEETFEPSKPEPTPEPTTPTSTPKPPSIPSSEPTVESIEPTPNPSQEPLIESTPDVVISLDSTPIEIPVIEEINELEEIVEIITQQIEPATNQVQLTLPAALQKIYGAEQLLATLEAFMNVGSDMSPEQREQAQSVVVAAIITTQIAQMGRNK